MLLTIEGNEPVGRVPVQKHRMVSALNDFERQPADIMTRHSAYDAQCLGVDRVFNVSTSAPLAPPASAAICSLDNGS